MADEIENEEVVTEEEALPGAEALPTEEPLAPGEGEAGVIGGEGLGTILVTPQDIEGLTGRQVGDDIRLTVDANISDVDEDGNFTIAMNNAQLIEGGEPGTEVTGPASDITGAMVAEEEEL